MKIAILICAALYVVGVLISQSMMATHPYDALNLRGVADIIAGIGLVLAVAATVRASWRRQRPAPKTQLAPTMPPVSYIGRNIRTLTSAAAITAVDTIHRELLSFKQRNQCDYASTASLRF